MCYTGAKHCFSTAVQRLRFDCILKSWTDQFVLCSQGEWPPVSECRENKVVMRKKAERLSFVLLFLFGVLFVFVLFIVVVCVSLLLLFLLLLMSCCCFLFDFFLLLFCGGSCVFFWGRMFCLFFSFFLWFGDVSFLLYLNVF